MEDSLNAPLLTRALASLDAMYAAYTEIAASGDAGNWAWESEPRVIEARRVLDEAKADQIAPR